VVLVRVVPLLASSMNETTDVSLRVVLCSLDYRTSSRVLRYTCIMVYDPPTHRARPVSLIQTSSVSQLYEVWGTSVFMFIDRDGIIHAKVEGEMDRSTLVRNVTGILTEGRIGSVIESVVILQIMDSIWRPSWLLSSSPRCSVGRRCEVRIR
jgi:hypothetical protein